MSAKQIENLCHHYGETLSLQTADNELVIAKKNNELHYAFLDGSYIMSRNGWVETKLGRVFKATDNINVSDKRRQIMSSDYVAHIGTCGDFCQKFSLSLNHLTNLVFIAHGATWIWNWISETYPNTIQILDFWHAYEKICQVGALFFKDKILLKDWCESIKELLLGNQVNEVIVQLKSIDAKAEALKNKDMLITYLENNQHRMQYKTFRDQGYLIGSEQLKPHTVTLSKLE